MSSNSRNKSEEKDDDGERMRSPSVLSQSSVTSGALEWDHTADIGKYKHSRTNDGSSTRGIAIGDISTIERLAINKSSDLVNKSSNPNTERQLSPLKQSKQAENQRRTTNPEELENSSEEDSPTVTMKDDQPQTSSSNAMNYNKKSEKTAETKRWSSVDYSILEQGAFGFFNISAKKAAAENKKTTDNSFVPTEESVKILSHPSSVSDVPEVATSESAEVNRLNKRDLVHQMSDANRSETGDSQFADASDSPFEDKFSPQFTDAHESAVEDTSNSEFVDANDSATGDQNTSEFTDAHESIDVQYTDSDRSRRTDTGSDEDKTSAGHQLHSSPTYTVLNNDNDSQKRSKSKQLQHSDIRQRTMSSSEASDPASSKDVNPSSSRKFSSTDSQTTYTATSALPRQTTYTATSALPRQTRHTDLGIVYRTSSPLEPSKLYNIPDSQTEPGDTSDENQHDTKSRRRRERGASDASTDWEYGNENSKSDPTSRSKSRDGRSTHSDNGSTSHKDVHTGRSSASQRTSYPSVVERTNSSLSASEWQTSGLTRSEMEYKMRQTNSSSTGTSSVIWLELLANQENDLDGDPKVIKLKNKGVQTQETCLTKVNKKIGPGNNTTMSSSSDLVDDSNEASNSRKHLHRQSHVPRDENERKLRQEQPKLYREEHPRAIKTSSSELSPACRLIEKIIKASPTKPNKLVKVIDEHKNYHATKVEKDLRHLQRLVKIIHGSKGSPPSSSHTSTSTADETDSSYIRKYVDKSSKEKGAYHRGRDNEEDLHFKRPSVPYNKLSNKRCQTSKSNLPVDEDMSYTRHFRVATKGAKYSKAHDVYDDKRGHPKASILPIKHRKYDKSVQQHAFSQREDSTFKRDTQTAILQERIDELSSKFDTLADLLILNQEMNLKKELERENQEKKDLAKADEVSDRNMPVQKRYETIKKPPKPPVCFFIPFQNCESSRYGQKYINNEDRLKRDRIAERRNLNESPIFDDKENILEERNQYHNDSNDDSSTDSRKENCFSNLDSENCKSLQNAFRRYHAEFINRASKREAILTQLKLEREMRAELKRDWVRKYGECPSEASETLDKCLPPKGPRVMTHREMKQITAKNYKKAMEVQERNVHRKQEQEKKTNRLMSQLFAKKLRQKALRGDVNILHSTSLVRK